MLNLNFKCVKNIKKIIKIIVVLKCYKMRSLDNPGYDPSIVLCHNDLHGSNAMVGEYPDGTPIPDSVQIIDFDNSEYGFMAWDFEYLFTYWPYLGPTDDEIEDMVTAYLSVWNDAVFYRRDQTSVQNLTP